MESSSPPLLDLRGGDSPVLALLVRQALSGLAPGQHLEVLLTSPRWARDLPVIVRRAGDRCLGCRETGEGFSLLLARGGPPAP
ncbi:MAG: sulfurtransferase TusA family protein [Desulfarculus sp.]|nr:sulfurtransferase TusA family protein [Desulfarculus sp.]